MADLEIPDGFANITWIFSLSTNSHQFGFSHGIDVLTAGPHSAQDIADDAAHAFTSGYHMANVYNAWTFQRTHVIYNDGGDFFSADSLVGTAGTGGAGAVNTANLALIVQKSTGRAGRQYRGRMYWPCLSLLDADVSNAGVIDPTVRGVIAGNVGAFQTALEAESTVNRLVLLHGAPKVGPTPNPTAVTLWTVESLCGTQRRRMR